MLLVPPLRTWIRIEDLAWLLLFGALHAVSPVRHAAEVEVLVAIAIVQVATARIVWFAAGAGNWIAITLKLLLGWMLVGVTGGIASSYYPILLLPVVSASTTQPAWGATLTVVLAAAAYPSFVLFLDPQRDVLTLAGMREIALRTLFTPLVGFLTYQMAKANREEARRSQAAAVALAAANASLQRAEEDRRRAERLAALGQLTAGLAHELRNPLGTIRSSAELLSKRMGAGDTTAAELAGYITSEVDRTNSLVTRFLEFARPFHLRLAPASLAAVLDRAIDELERSRNSSPVSIVKNYAPEVPSVVMDEELMTRVFVNLVGNAIEASRPGGVVTVKTRMTEGGVDVLVVDRGAGIAPEHRNSIFNPFFTTKRNGVGLGLAIVSKIVDEHGGRVLVDSTPGEGTVFQVWLPHRAF